MSHGRRSAGSYWPMEMHPTPSAAPFLLLLLAHSLELWRETSC